MYYSIPNNNFIPQYLKYMYMDVFLVSGLTLSLTVGWSVKRKRYISGLFLGYWWVNVYEAMQDVQEPST